MIRFCRSALEAARAFLASLFLNNVVWLEDETRRGIEDLRSIDDALTTSEPECIVDEYADCSETRAP